MKNIIVTCALPYANGDLHLGHILEQIQADIWVRFQRMQGNTCYFISADDTHGTPIMLKANELGITPEELIAINYDRHIACSKAFSIEFDNYDSTNSVTNKNLVYDIYSKLQEKHTITEKAISQLFDVKKQMFLPDRYIKGICPKCGSKDQYGDNCESCGASYDTTDIIDPISVISNTTPELRNTIHYFFTLSNYTNFLRDYLQKSKLSIDAINKMQEWLNTGLQDWNISRDEPYFGFLIPNTTNKYFYVWLDAPIGYIASLVNLCNNQNLSLDMWNSDQTQIYHFFGKDILYFHALFWIAILHVANYKLPSGLFVHGFLTLNGQKMSKSKGNYISVEDFLKTQISPQLFRYYIASKLSSKIEDIDFTMNDFALKINSELVGKFINIIARTANFMQKFFNNTLAGNLLDDTLCLQVRNDSNIIKEYFYEREYAKALRHIATLNDSINTYIDTLKPWIIAKQINPTSNLQENSNEYLELHQICTNVINAIKYISIYLKPVIPEIIKDVESYLNIKSLQWTDLDDILLNHQINDYKHIISRLDKC